MGRREALSQAGRRRADAAFFFFGSAAASVAGAAFIAYISGPTAQPIQAAGSADVYVPEAPVVKAAAAGIPGKDDIVAEFSGRKPVL